MTCPYPCRNKTEYGHCKTTGCINPKFDRTRTFTWYDPIEIARQYAPKFDKPEVEVAEVKHGRWVHKYGDGHTEPAITGGECSLCGFVSTTTNYCPNCGARMDGGEE